MKQIFFIAIILLISQITFGQKSEFPKLPQNGNKTSDFIPQDWKIAQQIDGDLNGDGVAETVLVLQGSKKELIGESSLDFNLSIENEKGETKSFADNNPLILAVLSKAKDGYKLFAQNSELIPSFLETDFRWDYDISLENEVLEVELIGRLSGLTTSSSKNETITFRFQMQNNRLFLVKAQRFAEIHYFRYGYRRSFFKKYDFLKNKGYLTSTTRTDNQPVEETLSKVSELISFDLVPDSFSRLDYYVGLKTVERKKTNKDALLLLTINYGPNQGSYLGMRDEYDKEESEIVENEIVKRRDRIIGIRKFIYQLDESDESKCKENDFEIIDWANGRFIATTEKDAPITFGQGSGTGRDIGKIKRFRKPQNAYLYRLCSEEKPPIAAKIAGIIIIEKGKVKAHYSFTSNNAYKGIGVLPDINQNGLSEIVLEFADNSNSQNFTAIGIFEADAKNKIINLGETNVFQRAESQKENEIFHTIFVKKGKSPEFFCETYRSEFQKNGWEQIKSLAKFKLDKPKIKIGKPLPNYAGVFDLILGHPPISSDLNSFDKLVFEFKDASVKPESQRNYKIILTKTSAEIVLESYKVLDRKTIKITEQQFDKIFKIVQNANLKSRPNLDDNGCAGGTTDNFEFFSNGKSSFKGLVYHCGGDDFGNMIGSSNAVKEALTSLFPTVKAKFRNID